MIVFAECSGLPYCCFLLFISEKNYSDHFAYIPRNWTVISSSTFIPMITYAVATAENEGCDIHLVAATQIMFPMHLTYWKHVYWYYWGPCLIWFKLKMLLCFVQQISYQEFGPFFLYGSRTGLRLIVKNTTPISPIDDSYVNISLCCLAVSKLRTIQQWDLKYTWVARTNLLNSCGWHQRHVLKMGC